MDASSARREPSAWVCIWSFARGLCGPTGASTGKEAGWLRLRTTYRARNGPADGASEDERSVTVQSLPDMNAVLCPPGTRSFRGLFLRACNAPGERGASAPCFLRLRDEGLWGAEGSVAVTIVSPRPARKPVRAILNGRKAVASRMDAPSRMIRAPRTRLALRAHPSLRAPTVSVAHSSRMPRRGYVA